MTQNPDQTYVDRTFPGSDGALFKVTADQSQDFDYVGDDPTAYDGFDQATGKKRHDKQTLIELLKFVEESSDQEFASGLAGLVDVEELARMLALNNILQNWDSIGTGPGGNYYLWYDSLGDRIVPLAWDFNLSLGGSATASPEPLAETGPGGGGAPGAVVIDVGADAGGDAPMPPLAMDEQTAAAMEECAGDGTRVVPGPAGGPPRGEDTNEGQGPAEPGDVVDVAGSMTNALVERFVSTPQFRALYDQAMEELTAELLTSESLLDELDSLATALTAAAEQRASLGSADDISAAVAAVRQFLDDRGDFLSTALG
jgi:spore coat protein CotH